MSGPHALSPALCRRAKRPGEPLREVVPADAEYGRDWESDAEDEADSSRAVLERWNDAQAAASGDARVAVALAAARRAARAAGRDFDEPAYDSAGALDAENLTLTLRGGGEGANRGVRLEELLARRLLSEEGGAAAVGDLPAWATADFGRPAPVPPVALPAEDAYVGEAIDRGDMPAVIYALLRRRARLTRLAALPPPEPTATGAAAVNAAAEAAAALARFETEWGAFLTSAMTGEGAPPSAAPPETDVLLQRPPGGGGSGGGGGSFDLEAFAKGVTRAGAAADAENSSGTLEGLWATAMSVARRRGPAAPAAAPRSRPAAAAKAAAAEDAALDGSEAAGFGMDDRNAAEARTLEQDERAPRAVSVSTRKPE